MSFIALLLVRHERKNRDYAGAFHRNREATLMARAVTADAARQDLATFRDVFPQPGLVFVIDRLEAIGAKRTDFAFRAALFFGRAFGFALRRGHSFTFM
jgi:hypothetical protein